VNNAPPPLTRPGRLGGLLTPGITASAACVDDKKMGGQHYYSDGLGVKIQCLKHESRNSLTVSPSRWGYAATASTANLNVIQPPLASVSRTCTATVPASFDPLWKQDPRTWLTDMGLMLLLGVAFTLIAWWRLIQLSPGRPR
jgi:hypothetical protein